MAQPILSVVGRRVDDPRARRAINRRTTLKGSTQSANLAVPINRTDCIRSERSAAGSRKNLCRLGSNSNLYQSLVSELAEKPEYIRFAAFGLDVVLACDCVAEVGHPNWLADQFPDPRPNLVKAVVHRALHAEKNGFAGEIRGHLVLGCHDDGAGRYFSVVAGYGHSDVLTFIELTGRDARLSRSRYAAPAPIFRNQPATVRPCARSDSGGSEPAIHRSDTCHGRAAPCLLQ